jgi:nonsense-mediated mRNA decay protein 3
MCINCLKNNIDITENIPELIEVSHCRECNRYRRPPWCHMDRESKEMMSFCLRQIKCLNKSGLKMLDAQFIWTEPHSRRIKIKLIVQKEVMNKTML